MKAIDVGLRNPYLVVVVVLAVAVVGMTAVTRIPADLLPIFKTPAVQIVTFYPGMAPEVMERDIGSRLERWTAQSVGIEHQEAKAMLGVSVIKNFFREDISFDTAMSQVTSYAMSDLFYLPPGTIPPMVMPFDPTASVPLCLVSVSSPTMSEKELYDVAYFELRNRLMSIQGVIAPAVYGGVLRRILAYVDRHELEARGLSPMDVVGALKGQNVLVPTGDAKFGDINYQIVSNAMEEHVERLNDVPIKTDDQAVVFMRDLGEVKDSHQIQSNAVRINGRREVYLPIYRQPGANTIAIVDDIKSQLEMILNRLREMDPRAKALTLQVVMDQSAYVRSSINGLKIAASLGALLAGIVVLVFLRSLRSTFVIVLAIPLAILATFIGLFYTGDTINSMTLGGIALAIGVLVDQSIVVLDNINRHMRMGKSGMEAALDGTREVALPVLVSTVTFIVVFFPIVFLTGIPRFLFQPLAVTVTFAVIASYVVAMFVIPAFCAKFLGEPRASARADVDAEGNTSSGTEAARAEARGSSSIVPAWFRSAFDRVLSLRFGVIACSVVLLAVAAFLLSRSGSELFPQVDSNQFTIYARLPSGTRIERTEARVEQIERVLMEEIGQPDTAYRPGQSETEKYPDSNMRILISNIGVLMDWPAAYTPNTGPMDAFLLVQLKGKDGMPNTFDYVARLREKLNNEFPDVEFAFDTGGMMTAALNFGLPSPINVRVQGSNLFTAEDIARHVRQIAAGVPGATDVRIAQRMDYPQIDVQVDRVKAAQLGVSQEDVVKNVVTTVNSSINFDPAFWIDERNGNHYFFGAQYAEEDIESIETLRNIPITGNGSVRPVSLRNIAEFRRKTGPAVVNHINITRTLDIFANVEQGYDVGTVAAGIERRLTAAPELKATPRTTPRGVVYDVGGEYAGKGYSFSMAGEVETMRSSFKQFAGGLLIAVILVYLTMVAQLRSFGVPFVILLTIPLGFIGVGFMLYLTGTNLSIPVAMGVIMMTGIVVEYSIILLEFANQLVREGKPVRQAITEATWIRLRPVLMASLTTWLALLPMAIGGAGGEANAPLARTIIGGVLAATVLSLVVAPCLYLIFKREERAEVVPATA